MKLLIKHFYFPVSILFSITYISCNHSSKTTKQSVPSPVKEPVKAADTHWVGTWERDDRFDGASLTVTRIIKDSIEFNLWAQSGGHTGEMEGKAYIKGNVAYYEPTEDKACKATFTLMADSVIVKANGCDSYTGIGVTFDGKYTNSKALAKTSKKSELASMRVVLTASEDSVFRKLVGKDYQTFVSCTQLTYDGDNLDAELQAKVISGAVRGLFTSMENIIMIDSTKHIWAAVIEDSERVNYYTNDKQYANKLPKTIENWRQTFKDYPVIYKSK
ncbi:hypothetical protein MUGA111182_18640 [Mucilaginibacter galii]|uniref:Uncharacterized protein n=1 Tax=Mucilaginibacter galii TaxID=2005073 RepID=A0A917JBA6_9SPHI|nr:hypothetical protein [Mucilaginibacter galii]GGI51300.1 hypothetical protein GCM10011425_25120 [Mucilaginibacter galii]